MIPQHLRLVPRLAALLLLVLGLAACDVNAVPRQDEAVKAAWSQVLNQYQRRTDLIPNLVETVKGYAHQEKQVLTAVTEARAKATQMQLPADVLSNPDAFQPVRAEPGGAQRRARPAAGGERALSAISNRTRISWRCNRSSKAPRTASRWRGATTSPRCRPTTRRCAPSRAAGSRRGSIPTPRCKETFTISEQAQQVPQVKF